MDEEERERKKAKEEWEKLCRQAERNRKIGMAIGIFFFILGLIIMWLGSPVQVEFTGALCSIGGLFLTIVLALVAPNERLVRDGFAQMNKHFERMDKHFEHMDENFERMDGRFDRMDGRFVEIISLLKELPKEIAKHLSQ